MAKHVIGIDLGTTNSCVATLDPGQPPHVLENAEGGRTTPSVVAFLDDGDRLVGAAARRQAVTNPTRTIFSIKRFMGRKQAEVKKESATIPYELVAGPNDAVRVLVDGREYTPEQISALVLGKLRADAEAYLGDEVTQAVITVPAYFNDAQRQATKDAAAIAGLEVLRIINEPTAAALAYGFVNLDDEDEKTILVFDLGGGTFDVSVLEVGDSVYDVKATRGDNHLGGDDFDKLVVDWMVSEFKRTQGVDLSQDAAALQRLYEAAEKAKIELSTAPRTQISLPFITATNAGPSHLDVWLTRAKLNELCEELIERCVAPVQGALDDARNKGVEHIDSVLLVGGMTRMPAIAEKVKELTGLMPLRGINPDEAVALGAAVQAGVLSGGIEDVLLLDVTPLSLGLETKGGIMTKLIEANTTLPVAVSETFTTAEDNQPSVEIHVLQGEREMARDNRSLGRVVLFGIPPALAGTPQVDVTFDLDVDGILKVTASDLGTGVEQSVKVEASTGLDSVEVERMRAEAQRFAERDKQQRELAEKRNHAEALRDQARRALRQYAEQMDDEDRASVSAAIDALDEIIEDSGADIDAVGQAQDDLARAVQAFSEKLYSDVAERAAPHQPEGGMDEDEFDDVELIDEEELELD